MERIERTRYMHRLLQLKDTPDIKVVTGIRRSGKSELMLSYIDWLRQNDSNANIIFIDLQLLDNESLLEYHALHNYVESQYKEGVHNYLLVDEVQMCKQFELAINSLHAKRKYDIYLTGSNAFLLSSDLATLFTGRMISIDVFPFSFEEYRKYFGAELDIQGQFDRYVTTGGFAGCYPYRTENDRKRYVREVYDTIVQRDLVEKYGLPDTNVLSHLAEYMMDNVSNITSPTSISDKLTQNGTQTNHTTIIRYMEHLLRAYVFYKVKRYDVRGQKYLQSLDKYYLADCGLRFAILGNRNMDYGRMYENIVALELIRRGYDIYIGKLYKKEIDFVAMRGSEKIYIQVSDNITSNETFEREVSPLLQIRDAYPKMLIARTRNPQYDYHGIQIIDLAEWLLNAND